jgi:hypothetical protein
MNALLNHRPFWRRRRLLDRARPRARSRRRGADDVSASKAVRSLVRVLGDQLDAAENTQTLTGELTRVVAELNPERLAMTEARA